MKTKSRAILSIALIHFLICLGFVYLHSAYVLASLEVGEKPLAGKVINTVLNVLNSPVVTITLEYAPNNIRRVFSGLYGYILFVANSLLWAVVLYCGYGRLRKGVWNER